MRIPWNTSGGPGPDKTNTEVAHSAHHGTNNLKHQAAVTDNTNNKYFNYPPGKLQGLGMFIF